MDDDPIDLLTNAVESIQIGVEDWQEGSRPRLLSALRNIHAGILLLYKEALVRLSPDDSNEVLIKSRIKPVRDHGKRLRFVGVGRKTADSAQIRERFESLGIEADWDQFRKISDLRNDVEHYCTNVSADSLRGAVATAFILIKTFAEDELGEQPRELLGRKTWDVMLKAAELYAKEREECQSALNKVEWESETLQEGVAKLACTVCGSDLLRPVSGSTYSDVVLECRSCGEELRADQIIPRAIEEATAVEAYIAVDDGADEPVAECPWCHEATYVMSEHRCAACGHQAEHECSRCGGAIPPSELASSPLCGYCEHMMSKDD